MSSPVSQTQTPQRHSIAELVTDPTHTRPPTPTRVIESFVIYVLSVAVGPEFTLDNKLSSQKMSHRMIEIISQYDVSCHEHPDEQDNNTNTFDFILLPELQWSRLT